MEVALTGLKFLAIVITGILAVIGIQVDFKDKEGRITTWGRLALLGTVLSVFVAVSIQVFETISKRREDEASAKKTQALINESRRARYPIQSILVTSNVIVPRTALPDYAARLEKAIPAVLKEPLKYDADVDTLDDGAPLKISLSAESQLYPDRGTPERALLVDVGLQFHFYKQPINISSVGSGFALPKADLQFTVRPPYAEIKYSLWAKRFLSLAMNMEASRKDIGWSSNGNIASLADLDGVQMIVTLENSFGYDRSKVQLLFLLMDIGGRRLLIGSGLSKATNADPKDPVYSFTFPQHVLDADEYLGQDKAAEDKILARAIFSVERRHE